jgi:hypothetical protein
MAGRRASVSVSETRVEWIKPEIVNNCEACQASFGIFRRKHHCRHCGHVFCDSCTPSQMKLPPQFGYTEPQVSNNCFVPSRTYVLESMNGFLSARLQRLHPQDSVGGHMQR